MPVFKSAEFKVQTKIPRATCIRVIDLLTQNNVLFVLKKGQGREGNVYGFKKLLDIVA